MCCCRPSSVLAVGLVLLLAACAPPAGLYDFDGDGALDAEDCAPDDPTAFPGAEDRWGDGVDQDCDGLDGVDGDADGFASQDSGGDDCNDEVADVHPGAAETPDNGVDEDCADGDLLCDLDGDGLAIPACGGLDCDGTDPACGLDCSDGDSDGFAACQGDCDDADPARAPDHVEACDGVDGDCDGDLLVEEVDGDGDGLAPCDGDCDDDDPLRAPGQAEACDGLDNDCADGTWAEGGEEDFDGDGDLACSDCEDHDGELSTLDLDGDLVSSCDGDCDDDDPLRWPGAPDGGLDGVDNNCDGPPGVDGDGDGQAGVATGGPDCDDARTDVYSGATELCDDRDNDCDGDVDEDFDLDGDGATTCAGDCDDDDATTGPSAGELCDGLDNDCDGVVPADEVDADGDGAPACADCDDAEPGIHPAAAEVCDGVDQDCDAVIDQGFDVDADGVTSCGGDCDDSNAAVKPGEAEACDGFDTDCDASTSPALGEADGDGDGYLPCAAYIDHGATDSAGDPLSGADDCDDTEASVHPGAGEVCDGVDGDCDPGVSAAPSEQDVDADGHLPCAPFVDAGAVNAAGLPLVGGDDCDDLEPARHPGHSEVCDGFDNDCDGATTVPEGEDDADGDRHLPCAGFVANGAKNGAGKVLLGGEDCDEGSPLVFPGNPEVCDGIDNDCDLATLPGDSEDDADHDRHLACSDFVDRGLLNAVGLTIVGGLDCDDADPSQVPGAWEDPGDGWDGSCDGLDSTSLSWASVGLVGEVTGDNAGNAVAGRGDVDGDGLDDLLIGAHDWDRGPGAGGAVAIVLGSSLEPGVDQGFGEAWVHLVGEQQGYTAGHRVAWAGDVDGDGLDDLLVQDEVPDRVYLVLASSLTPGVTSLADAHAVFDDPPEGFKRAIEGIGDVDGDGLDDVALGGFGSSTQIMLYLGSDLSAGGTFTYADAHATFDNGEDSVAGLGDLDGDGLDDLLLGDPWYTPNGVSNSGRALVWYGASLAAGGTFAAEDADVTLIGEGGHNKLGAAVAAAGDVDGDGLPDLLISAPGWEGVVMGGGKVYLVLGSQLPVSGSFPPASAHASILGTTRNGFLGEYGGLAGGADVDGDGLHDVVVSAWRDEEVGFEAGATWLFSGATLASGGTLLVSSADAAFVGEATGDRSGVVIDLTGDHDGDGRAEVLVGAEYNDEGGSQAGKVYLLAMPP